MLRAYFFISERGLEMKEDLKNLEVNTLAAIEDASSDNELADLRQEVLGRKGQLTNILKGLGKLEPDLRKEFGKVSNEIKNKLQSAFDQKEAELLKSKKVLSFKPDLTLPGIAPQKGGLHPITQIIYELNDAFKSLNFDIFEEAEVSSELYAFDKLNFPPEHPARESMDTYWIEGTEDKHGGQRHCLRPHLTGASVRYLEEHGGPCRFVYPGRVFRNENTDARHERAFYQYEALIIEKNFPFASGQLLISTILDKVFGRQIKTRMRSGYFPFVEPGFEIDMQCVHCEGRGCPVCKHVGWIEVMPGGTPHPNVLKAAGLDPHVWTGFYIDIGLERLAMMRYGIPDVRLFHSGDLRFLKQFQ